MAYVHGNKILHGDLKPLNILIDQNDVAHVADFGLSRIKATTASLRAGTIIQGFTPVFSAPELLRYYYILYILLFYFLSSFFYIISYIFFKYCIYLLYKK